MRKFVLLLAVALLAAAPLVAASTTETYAAAKKAAKKDAKKVEPNAAVWMALGDLANSIGKPWPAKDDSKGKAKGKKKA
jgi:hypothetical protein